MVVLLATSQQVSSASAFVACVMPTAPGVNEATFASEPDPTIHMIDSNVTGIAKAARKIPTTVSLQSHERNDGKNARVKYSFGRERITPPCFAWAQSFFTCFQKTRPRSTIKKAPPTTMRIVVTGFSEMFPRFSLNEPGTDRKR
jgi:hypothetical protein